MNETAICASTSSASATVPEPVEGNEVSGLRAENAKLREALIWARLVHPEIVWRAKEGSLHAEELLELAPDIVSGEGELVKKGVFHQHGLDHAKMYKEIGDVLWYVAALCTKLGFDMGDIMAANIDKLRERYPDGYSSADSQRRVDTHSPYLVEWKID